MSAPRFVQIHTLSSYPAVLLNRDDAGLAKRLPYGGHSRIRVSCVSDSSPTTRTSGLAHAMYVST